MSKQLLIAFLSLLIIFILSCSDKSSSGGASKTAPPAKADEGLGVGPFTHIELNDPLDQDMVAAGKAIYDLKCYACHLLSEKRLVGPGYKGITKRRKPEWIMNMITNVDIMLEKDSTAQALLGECLTRMPNQNVTTEDARNVLEFMLNNDSEPKSQ